MNDQSHALTADQARSILDLAPDAGLDAARRAFRAAAKLAHPDRPGGDAARFRQVLEAYRVLQAAPSLPALSPAPFAAAEAPDAFIEISPLAALNGGEIETILADGRKLTVRVPPGARHGERLRVDGVAVAVRIAPDAAVMVRGSDLWVTVPVEDFLLADGGRTVIDTPLGPRTLWISRAAARRRLVRLEGQGLPARGRHAQGSLFIRLAAEAEPEESAARAQLKRFAAAWAA